MSSDCRLSSGGIEALSIANQMHEPLNHAHTNRRIIITSADEVLPQQKSCTVEVALDYQ